MIKLKMIIILLMSTSVQAAGLCEYNPQACPEGAHILCRKGWCGTNVCPAFCSSAQPKEEDFQNLDSHDEPVTSVKCRNSRHRVNLTLITHEQAQAYSAGGVATIAPHS